MNKEEIVFLREHLKEICEYKGLQQELTYDISIEILKRVCKVLDFLQQENQQLKEKCEKQQFAIVENCDLRLEIEQLKQIEKKHQKINGELREEIYEYAKSIDLWANKYNEEIDKKKELRNWLEEYINILKENDIYDRDMDENGRLSMLESVLSKLNELEGKNENNT